MICARKECQVEFEQKTHNQKYCGPECCRIETNRRIMEKYYARRDRKLGKVRFCDECKVTKLSRYNDTHVCGSCTQRATQESRSHVLGILAAVSA